MGAGSDDADGGDWWPVVSTEDDRVDSCFQRFGGCCEEGNDEWASLLGIGRSTGGRCIAGTSAHEESDRGLVNPCQSSAPSCMVVSCPADRRLIARSCGQAGIEGSTVSAPAGRMGLGRAVSGCASGLGGGRRRSSHREGQQCFIWGLARDSSDHSRRSEGSKQVQAESETRCRDL